MDTELYQILSLALLGLIGIALLAIAGALGKLRKTLAERGTGASATKGGRDEDETDEREDPKAETLSEEPAELSRATEAASTSRPEPEPSGEGSIFGTLPEGDAEPSPVSAVTPDPQPAAETPTSQAPEWDLEEDRFAAQYEPRHEEPSTSEPELVTESPAASGSETASEPAADASDGGEDPEDQPFERDGKWFFRRGHELLTYEESTGQWIPADGSPSPAPTAPAAASQAQSLDTGQDFGPLDSDTSDAGEEEAAPETAAPSAGGGGFWKCPSCGAVNGSTATTCRMCFTARP